MNQKSSRIILTEQLARASATDAANIQMRAAGRKAWSIEDANLASATFARLIPYLPLDVRLRLTGNAEGTVNE
jgi:hypothetical protein